MLDNTPTVAELTLTTCNPRFEATTRLDRGGQARPAPSRPDLPAPTPRATSRPALGDGGTDRRLSLGGGNNVGVAGGDPLRRHRLGRLGPRPPAHQPDPALRPGLGAYVVASPCAWSPCGSFRERRPPAAPEHLRAGADAGGRQTPRGVQRHRAPGAGGPGPGPVLEMLLGVEPGRGRHLVPRARRHRAPRPGRRRPARPRGSPAAGPATLGARPARPPPPGDRGCAPSCRPSRCSTRRRRGRRGVPAGPRRASAVRDSRQVPGAIVGAVPAPK